MAVRLQLRNVRLSYANIWKAVTPQNDPGAEPKFSVALLIDKDDKRNLKALKAKIAEAMEDGKSKLGRINMKKFDKGVRDGDEKLLDDEETVTDGYENVWYINAKAGENYPPQIVDNRRRPIKDESKVYSGCYANVFVDLYAYSSNGNQGIGFGLLGIQKVADGEPLGSSFSSDLFDEFDADYEDDDDLGGDFDDYGDSRKQKSKKRNDYEDDDDWGDDGAEDFDDFGPDPDRGKKQKKKGKCNSIDIDDDDLPF